MATINGWLAHETLKLPDGSKLQFSPGRGGLFVYLYVVPLEGNVNLTMTCEGNLLLNSCLII